jgi:hypothetical protein
VGVYKTPLWSPGAARLEEVLTTLPVAKHDLLSVGFLADLQGAIGDTNTGGFDSGRDRQSLPTAAAAKGGATSGLGLTDTMRPPEIFATSTTA